MSLRIHQRLFAVTLSATFTVFLFGCDSTQSRKTEFFREEGKYYRAYLDGDVRQARQSVEQLIQHCQSPQGEILGASGQAHDLFCAYGRLYVLEKRTGDKDAAEVALTRARYWHLQSYEADADWQRRVPLHDFLSYQTPEWFEDTMGKLDKGANRGSEPKYIQYLPDAQPNPEGWSERDAAVWLRDKSDISGGCLPSLTLGVRAYDTRPVRFGPNSHIKKSVHPVRSLANFVPSR